MLTPKVDELWRSGQEPTVENRGREAAAIDDAPSPQTGPLAHSQIAISVERDIYLPT